ncbi:FISUMP domain-containing protein, partial [Bacteroidota bacterium]
MKKNFLFSFLILIINLSVFNQGSLDSGLVSYYPFTGNAVDSSIYENDGFINGAIPTTDRFGNNNSAYSFDGINDYIYISNPVSQVFSISVWFKYDTSLNQNTVPLIYANDGYYKYIIGIINDKPFCEIYTINIAGNKVLSNKPVSDTKWHHLVMVWSRTENILYLDGEYQAKQGYDIDTLHEDGFTYFGFDPDPASLNHYKGKMDEISFYDRVLTETEILQLYKNFHPPESFAVNILGQGAVLNWSSERYNAIDHYDAYIIAEGSAAAGDTIISFAYLPTNSYHFFYISSTDTFGNISMFSDTITRWVGTNDDPSAYYPFTGNTNDSSGNENHGTANGATLTTDRFGNSNSACFFDGIDDYIEISDNAVWDFNNDFTIILWAISESIADWTSIIGQTDGSGINPKRIFYFSGSNRLSFHTFDKDLINPFGDGVTTAKFSDGYWHQITLVRKDSTFIFWQDTNKLGTLNWLYELSNPSNPVIIGRTIPLDHNQNNFNGAFDDIRVYNKALDSIEIIQHYDNFDEADTIDCLSIKNENNIILNNVDFDTLNIETITLQDTTLIIYNTSPIHTINISNIYTNYSLYQDNISTANLSPGDSLILTLSFNPPDSCGLFIDTLYIESDNPRQAKVKIPLSTLIASYIPTSVFTENITWFKKYSPYILRGNVAIDMDYTLSIEPGVNVQIGNGLNLTIDGNLNAQGTETDSIFFTGLNGNSFGRIQFRENANINMSYFSVDRGEIYISNTNVTLKNGLIKNSPGDGIDIVNGDLSANNLLIKSNAGYGIMHYRNSDGYNLSLDSCIINNNNEGGIYYYSFGIAKIENCIINNNQKYGLYLGQLFDNSVIKNSTIIGTTQTGSSYAGLSFRYTYSNNVLIENNNIAGNNCGIYVYYAYSEKMQIHNNSIYNNLGDGIRLENSAPLITYNDIYANDDDGIEIMQHANNYLPVINYNNIYNDTAYALNVKHESTETINAEHNYWGATSESDINNKIFDFYDNAVGTRVDYTPWYNYKYLTITADKGDSKIFLNWNTGQINETTYYYIYRNSSIIDTIIYTNSNIVEYIDSNLINYQSYNYWIISLSQSGTINQISDTIQAIPCKIISDIDGNEYNSVKIGDQIWFSENLRVTKYTNGTKIPLITDDSEWGNLEDNNTDDAYCWYNNDSITYAITRGALYTWAAVMNGQNSSNNNPSGIQGVCPDGWHLPSYNEWEELENFISTDGYSGNEGTVLKASNGWDNNGNGIDIYGFSALPGGFCDHNDGFFYSGSDNAYWISSAETSSNRAWGRSISSSNSTMNYDNNYKSEGNSVRCLKDYELSNYLSISIDTLDFGNYNPSVSDSIQSFELANLSSNRNIIITELTGLNTPFSISNYDSDTILQESSITISINLTTNLDTGLYIDTLLIETNIADTFIIIKAKLIQKIKNDLSTEYWMVYDASVLPSQTGTYTQPFDLRSISQGNPGINFIEEIIDDPERTGNEILKYYQPDTNASLMYRYNFDDNWLDSSLTIIARVKGIEADMIDRAFDIQWRNGNAGTRDELRISPIDSTIELEKADTVVKVNYNLFDWHIYRIQVIGDSATIFIDEETSPVLAYSSPTLSEDRYIKIGDGSGNTVAGYLDYIILDTTGAYTPFDDVEIIDSLILVHRQHILEGLTIFTDNRDGQEYKYVKIGDQTWMAENLKSTFYTDGTALTDGSGVGSIDGDYTTRYYFSYNDDPSNNDTYGYLYTWAAAINGETISSNQSNVKGVCPDDWHLPSDDEWKELEMYLGMSQADADVTDWRGTNEGSKLGGETNLWTNGVLVINSEFGTSGFDALPGGHRTPIGDYYGLNNYGYWWCATEHTPQFGWIRYIYYEDATIHRQEQRNDYGLSVRCVKDKLDSSLIAYYPFNGNANDESGNNNHGTVNGATLTTDMFGNMDKSYNFDGTDDYIQIPDYSFLPAGNSSRSMFCWIKTNGEINNRMNFIGYGSAGDYQSFDLSSIDGRIYFIGYNNDLHGNSIIADGNWHFIGTTFNRTTIKLYVDGVFDSQAEIPLNTIVNSSNPFVIGRQSYGDGSDYHYVNGNIDEIKIYNYALSPEEIKNQYEEYDLSKGTVFFMTNKTEKIYRDEGYYADSMFVVALEEAGYNVYVPNYENYHDAGNGVSLIDNDKLDTIRNADLVIFGRITHSSLFTDINEKDRIWGQFINPIMNMSTWHFKGDRLNFGCDQTLPLNRFDTFYAKIENTDDAAFSGITIPGDSNIPFANGNLGCFTTQPEANYGEILLSLTGNGEAYELDKSSGDIINTFNIEDYNGAVIMSRWSPGELSNIGYFSRDNGIPQGYRSYFSAGDDHDFDTTRN